MGLQEDEKADQATTPKKDYNELYQSEKKQLRNSIGNALADTPDPMIFNVQKRNSMHAYPKEQPQMHITESQTPQKRLVKQNTLKAVGLQALNSAIKTANISNQSSQMKPSDHVQKSSRQHKPTYSFMNAAKENKTADESANDDFDRKSAGERFGVSAYNEFIKINHLFSNASFKRRNSCSQSQSHSRVRMSTAMYQPTAEFATTHSKGPEEQKISHGMKSPTTLSEIYQSNHDKRGSQGTLRLTNWSNKQNKGDGLKQSAMPPAQSTLKSE